MKELHVILRRRQDSPEATSGARVRATRPTGLEMAESAPSDVAVQVEELGGSDIEKISRDKDVDAIAPVVPMKLIEPLNMTTPTAVSTPRAGGVAWGVEAVGAHKSDFTGEGITVAVLDTGIDAAHPAFTDIQIIQKNFTTESPGDVVGHGTHCAGTIFGRPVDGMRIGVAQGVTKALIGKVLGKDSGSSDQIASAIQWALDNGANVISMSLGIDFPGLVKLWQVKYNMPQELAVSRALDGYRANVLLFERLASYVRAQGPFSRPAVMVAAAGNESRRTQNPDFVIGVSPPAVSEGVISVAALGQEADGLGVASFSNRGALVAGPGVGIVSAGAGSQGLVAMSGTSMATPHVAGVAALWAQWLRKNGVLNFEQLSGKLTGTATKKGLKDGIVALDVGAGLVQAP